MNALTTMRRGAKLAIRRVATTGVSGRGLGGLRCKSDLVTLEQRGRVAILRLNDPKRLNPMTGDMGKALQARVAEINARADEIGAVVLTGEGRAFSAVGDMKFLNGRITDTTTRNSVIMREFYSRYLSLRSLHVPLVAAINGPAIGAGLCISLFATSALRPTTRRWASRLSTWDCIRCDGMASSHFLPQIVGPETANYLMLTGKIFDGAEAEKLRVISKAVPADQVVDEAVQVASEMALASSTAVRAVLRTLRAKQDAGLDAALQREADAQAHSYATPDYAEGLKAIAEKRPPEFYGGEHYNLDH